MARNLTSVVCGVMFVCLFAGCNVFVPEKAFVNGGKAAGTPTIVQPSIPAIPLVPTETTLRWAGAGGDTLDRLTGCNAAVFYYGHKEKAGKEKGLKAPLLVLVKTIRKGNSESATVLFAEPPPPRLIYRLKILNIGSADYQGKVELTDQLPDEVTYAGIKAVHDRKLTYVPYVGPVETKHELDGWRVEPERGGKGARVHWWIDDVTLKNGHWITVDIEFEPPPFDTRQEGD